MYVSHILSSTQVTVDITNTGTVAGKEVPQLYVSFPSSTNSPPNQLRGFDKVLVSPKETVTATLTLTSRHLSIWTTSWTLVSGEVGLLVGASSRDIRLQSTIAL
jgi:beta-glucosidase